MYWMLGWPIWMGICWISAFEAYGKMARMGR
jgi:hypothetical protein